MPHFKAPLLAILLILLFWLSSCAVQSSPEGGFKDRDAPKIDTLSSTPNFTVNTKPQKIVMQFNEYVQVKNASKEVIVTPKLEQGRPKLKLSGKKVVVDLSTVKWRENTTYQIQFGEAISDLNEGNIANKLKYVFSTGNKLDSLELKCATTSRVGEKKPEKLKAALYLASDSTTSEPEYYKRNADYLTTPDETGNFNFNFLSPGLYHILIFEDTNNNSKFDIGSEQVAFLNNPVEVAELDSTFFKLPLSNVRPTGKLVEVIPFINGFWGFRFNQPPRKEWYPISIDTNTSKRYVSGDTLFISNQNLVDSLKEFVFNLENKLDTVPVISFIKSDTTLKAASVGIPDEINGEIKFTFNHPIKRFDTSKIEVIQDSIPFTDGLWTINKQDDRTIVYNIKSYLSKANENLSNVSVKIKQGGVTDLFNKTNQDSILSKINLKANKRLGSVELKLDSLTFTNNKPYFVELLSSSGAVNRTVLVTPKMKTVSWDRIDPGKYQLRITIDQNLDGKYTPGSIKKIRQPEPSFLLEMDEVRANWAIEYLVKLPRTNNR